MPGLKTVARQAGVKFADAIAIFEAILARVNHGERVVVSGFGVFYQGRTLARKIMSPVLKRWKRDEANVPSYKKLRFRASKMTRMVAGERGKGGVAKGTGGD